jgi:hypothetical protein
MSFRFLNQSPVYLDNDGVPLSGGSLTFSNTGTSTPKTVYSDKALSVSLGSVVTLDSTGRAPVDVWGSGSYRVVLKDSGGTTIKTLDDVDEILTGSGIPSMSGQSGKYLTNNGSVASWGTISQVPTQTGNAGKYLRTDGTNASWASPTLVPIVSTTASTSSLTPDAGFDAYHVTALAAGITINNPSGTWSDGQGCVVRIKDNGTPRTIAFGANFVAFDAALPTTTVASKEIYIPFIYNATTAKWNVIRRSQQV